MQNISLNKKIINSVLGIAKEAGVAILEVYQNGFEISFKEDKSPLTEADELANSIIMKKLKKITPEIPILSEEGKKTSYEQRLDWHYYWLVDPLDGTKDFIKKNGEFTVNIALLNNNIPIFGVVYAPVLDKLYWGSIEHGAWIQKGKKYPDKIVSLSEINGEVIIAGSRSHPSPKMNLFLSKFDNYTMHKIGSSLKICLVAEGSVHYYPRLGPTMEWDTAAAHAILKASGGEMINIGTNKPLKYNKENLVNPEFIAGNLQLLKKL